MILTFVIRFNVQTFQHVETQQPSLMVTYANAAKVSLNRHSVACLNACIRSHIATGGIVSLITGENRFVDAMEPDIMDLNAI